MKAQRRLMHDRAHFVVVTEVDNGMLLKDVLQQLKDAHDVLTHEGVADNGQYLELRVEEEYGGIYYTVQAEGSRPLTHDERMAYNRQQRNEKSAQKRRLEAELAALSGLVED